MINLIKCHYAYLINKTTVLIIFIVLVISLFGNLFALSSIANENNYVENNMIYFENYFFIVKLLSVFLSIFIFSYTFISKSDQYVFLIVIGKISRFKYFFSKIITMNLCLGVYVWFQYVIYLMVGYFGYSKFYFDLNVLIKFLNLFLLMIYFGNLGILFVLLMNNIYTVIIPFSIFNIGTIINEDSKNQLYLFYNLIFSNFKEGSSYFVYGYFHYIFILTCVFIINGLIYQYQDLK